MNDLDDLPIFRPRIGIRHPAASGREGSFRNTLLARLRRGAAAARRSPRGGAGAGARQANARRVVVKAHVVRMTPSGARAAALHLRYIERAGVEKDGSAGVLYTADGPAHAETFEQPRAGEKHQFRLIVSPEDGSELDLTAYVKRLMATVERDLGRGIEWAAVNHYDTGHPHAHVVVRGVDRDGQELRLDRAYISRGLRWRAQELATDELGPRREVDVRRAHAREVTQDRFTALDRELERRAKDSRFEVRSGRPGLIDESMLVARLEHLEGHRLAERLSPTSWKLTEGWQNHLREVGSRGDVLQQIHAAVAGDRTRYRIVVREALSEQEPSAPASPLVSRHELARLLGVSAATVTRMTAEGMPHVFAGASARYSADEVRSWLAERGRKGTSASLRKTGTPVAGVRLLSRGGS